METFMFCIEVWPFLAMPVVVHERVQSPEEMLAELRKFEEAVA